MIQYFRYIPYSETLWRFAEGWRPVADLGPTHGTYAVLCVWTGEGEPT
jgi:hypothetical protein